MARIQLDLVAPGDAPELSRLLTESTRGFAMPAFALERPGDIFRIMDVRGPEWKIVVARDPERGGRLAAYASVAYRPVYVNGAPRRVAHLLDVYFSPEYRRGMLLGRSFAFVRDHALKGEEYAQTQVCVDNGIALGAFTSGKAGLPAYLPYGEHAFLTLPVEDVPGMGRAGARARTFEVRRAVPADLPGLRDFFSEWAPSKQFYPLYAFDALGAAHDPGLAPEDYFLAFRQGRLAGVAGTWDQQAFKATHYLPPEGTPGTHLPPEADRPLFLHAMLTEHNDPAVFAALVDHIRATVRGTGYGLLALGLDARDTLRLGVEHIPHRLSLTRHFLVTYGADPRPGLRPGTFYLESARC